MDAKLDLTWTLAGAGLLVPPLIHREDVHLQQYGEWQWGTAPFAADQLYMFNHDEVRPRLSSPDPQLLLSHSGHGLNSYALTAFCSSGPLAAFVQEPFGGFYSDQVDDRERIAGTFARLHEIYARLGTEHGPATWLLSWSRLRYVATLTHLPSGRVEDFSFDGSRQLPAGVSPGTDRDARSALFRSVATRLSLGGTSRHSSNTEHLW